MEKIYEKCVQQGDVKLVRVKELPKLAKKGKTKIIVSSSNPHMIINGAVYECNGIKFVVAGKKARIQHREHKAINIVDGIWEVSLIREKGMLDDMIAPVVD